MPMNHRTIAHLRALLFGGILLSMALPLHSLVQAQKQGVPPSAPVLFHGKACFWLVLCSLSPLRHAQEQSAIESMTFREM